MNRYRIFIAAILFSGVFSAAGQGLPFYETFPSLTLNESKSLANAGDLNGDGRDDFLSRICDPGQIIMVLSSELGYTKTVLESDMSVAGVGLGDVNLDGIPDLIASSPQSVQLEFRYGSGHGTFGDPISIRYSRTVSSRDCRLGWSPVNIADIDGDGVEELVLVGRFQLPGLVYKRTAIVPLTPDGPVTRQEALYGETWPTGLGDVRDLRLADVDGDGDLDIALLLTDDPQVYLCRYENGTYTAPVALQAPGTLDFVFANMNGDSMPDLVQTSGTEIRVQLLNADGTSESITIDTGRFWRSYANVGDVDLDGGDDFVLVEYNTSMLHVVMTDLLSGTPVRSLLPFGVISSDFPNFLPSNEEPGSINYLQFGPGQKGYLSRIDPARDGVTPLFRTACVNTRGGSRAFMLDFGDPALNTYIEDGFGIRSYRLDAQGVATETAHLAGRIDQMLTGDFNADSLPDLAMIELNNVSFMTFIMSDPSAAFVSLEWAGFANTPQAAGIAIDIDQDGRDEVVVARNSISPSGLLFSTDGSQIFSSEIAISAPAVFGGAFDADADGYPDLILSDFDRTVVVHNRNGAFDGQPSTLLEGFNTRTVVGHDIDHDGFDDLILLRRWRRELAIFWGHPGGISEPQIIGDSISSSLAGVSIFDVDGNGFEDIVLSVDLPSSIFTPSVLFQTAARAFDRFSSIASAYGKSVVRTDVNSDGIQDTILLQSNQSFEPAECGAMLIFGLPGRTCAADLNADGAVDASDLSSLLSLYPEADPAIDLAAPFGVVNFSDIIAYLTAYNAGCP